MRQQIINRGVPADVAVKFAVEVIARIADLGRPNLLTCLDIASKNGSAVRANDRSMNAVTRTRITVEDRVRVRNEILDSGVFE